MKKTLMLFTVMISTVLFSTAVFAAAWNVPTNVRVVQKSNTDTTGRIYGNIQSAINSITNASATNPYVVKVMPGVYDLGTSSLQMKEYVTLEGSGKENTIITSSVNDTSAACLVGTIIMTNNSSLKNVTVKNIASNSGVWLQAIALNNIEAKFEGINAIVSGNYNRNNGICVIGTAGHIVLENSYVETNSTYAQSNPILATNGAILTMTNSKLMGIGSGGSIDVINCSGDQTFPGAAIITNSVIESSGNVPTYLANGESCYLTITNSKIYGNGNNTGSIGVSARHETSITNTSILFNGSGPNIGIETDAAYSLKVANSLIQQGISDLTNAKLFNNFDENFNPIANQ